jgi:YidC/Oxa1 family membrane protein insertase
MEKRAILAAVLMAALLILYQAYFFPSPPERPTPPQQPQAQQGTAEKPSTPAPASVPGMSSRIVERPSHAREGPRPPQRTATVDGPLYHAVISSESGKIQAWTLKYRGEKPMISIGELGPRGLLIGNRDDRHEAEPIAMRLSAESLQLSTAHPTDALTLSGEFDGLRVGQTLQFAADAYTVDMLVRVENAGPAPRSIDVVLPWVFRRQEKMPEEKFTGQRPTEIVWAQDGHVQRIEDLAAVGEHVWEGNWITIGSTWYLAALMPKTPGFKLSATSEPKNGAKNTPGETRIAVVAEPTVAPGQVWEGRVLLFIGPKEYERLRALGLEGTLNFGGFPVPRRFGGLPMEWLGVPILQLMNWVYRYVRNYGVAIIVLTVVSKLLFYPLTVKGMRSMKAMQALQPQINALRSKYKNDPRRLQEETLALYRQHKVNPMGGCLPMLAQVPVFYALYLALSVSVELQSAAFLCFGRLPSWVPWLGGHDVWICDLAHPDPTYLLPLLMGVTMFVQQKMAPTGGDPRQQKMMLIMPFVFTWMFLGLASGLVLYWTVSNVLQILQQWWMDRSRTRLTKTPTRA